ncbi:hypothetical protein [Actinomadura decatromicini]|uniref:Uncharacterized protein n=1 Tax=Actinomadura decatromicini TaxID=2604572 RepID=A0A5D3F748_9ACTN|nr:hypothetical protein [Actinomadura decatromicini]TYK43636.1 hypothetical protein FXF68_36390 [Actinomadura decatromicini]
MTTLTIDADELAAAAPQLTQLHLNLIDSARTLTGLDLGVEMPPGVRGRVVGAVDAARGDIMAAARAVEGLGQEVARRGGLAELADALGKLTWAVEPLKLQLEAIAKYSRSEAIAAAKKGNLDAAKVNRAYQLGAERLRSRLGFGGAAIELGSAVAAEFRNPYIGMDRKIGRSLAHAAVTVGLSRIPGPAGPLVQLTWTIADSKLHQNEYLADGATWCVDKVGDGGQWLDDNAIDPLGDAIGDAKEHIPVVNKIF